MFNYIFLLKFLQMKNLFFLFIIFFQLSSCTTKQHLIYPNELSSSSQSIIKSDLLENKIEIGDILKIDINSLVPEAAIPYNKLPISNNNNATNLEILQLEGYIVNTSYLINMSILGDISVKNLSIENLENKIKKILSDGNHLTNPEVKIRRINSKFTVLGEVKNAGTFAYYDENLTLLQALGYAGDLTIQAKRTNLTLVRSHNGVRRVYKFSLKDSNLFNMPVYQIKNNDVIIINPNYSKIKSAGFIGSPSSIASIASLLLSVTLLILNK